MQHKTFRMSANIKRRLFFSVFCLASVIQGMYSTYFVSILTTIERLYQIPSRTAGAIMSATEVGQIFGSLLIAYYGGKGNKPKWIAACMMLTAISAMISTSPHFIVKSNDESLNLPTTPYSSSEIITESSNILSTQATYLRSKPYKLPSADQLCYYNDTFNLSTQNRTSETNSHIIETNPININTKSSSASESGYTLTIFSLCLVFIGFGSTAITTLGIPFIDDIVSKEESPLYLGLTIGLRIMGPALGFLLGSFCIRLDVNVFSSIIRNQTQFNSIIAHNSYPTTDATSANIGAWWLGLFIISLPLLLLALPMYYISRSITQNSIDSTKKKASDLEAITYQAAEDHDIGGSRDFQTHVLTICDLDVTSNRTCYSEVDSSSREVLQATTLTSGLATTSIKSSSQVIPTSRCYNFGKNLTLDRPIITKDSILYNNKLDIDCNKDNLSDQWQASCLVVNHFGRLESTSFTNDEAKSLQSSTTSATNCSPLPSPTPSLSSMSRQHLTLDLLSSLSRLIKSRLLLLRMLSVVLHILPIAGFFTFLPKYLTEQFRIAPSSANAISGLSGILFVGFGAFIGGTIVKVLNVNSKFMTKWIASSTLLYTFGMLILMNLGCPENQTVHYSSLDFQSTDCLANCHCIDRIYSPVCANGTTFISPCLAGCKSYTISEDKIIFDECGCSVNSRVDTKSTTSTITLNNQTNKAYDLIQVLTETTTVDDSPTTSSNNHVNLNVATQGQCSHNCDNLKWYIVLFSIFTLIHASCEVGSMMLNLRCVKSCDRTLALGFITFASSLMGTIPCSVIYGTMIDLTCVHWDLIKGLDLINQNSNDAKGACRAYENDLFRYYLHGTTALVMFFAFIVDYIVSRCAKEINFYEDSDSRQSMKLGLEKSTETI